MRQLEQQLRLTRAVLRRSWARLSLVDPELGAPARIVIRLDEADLPGSLGPGEALVATLSGRRETHVWVLTAGAARYYRAALGAAASSSTAAPTRNGSDCVKVAGMTSGTCAGCSAQRPSWLLARSSKR